MALRHCDVVGLPQRCYVFPRYENACPAHVLWRSARRSRGKQCAALFALVSLYALASSIFTQRNLSSRTRL